MPLATLNLISLKSSDSFPSFVQSVKSLPASSPYRPIVLSKVIRWIITPSHIDAGILLNPSKPWDLLYIHLTPSSPPQSSSLSSSTTTHTNDEPNKSTLPSALHAQIHDSFTLQVGIPSRILSALSSSKTATTTSTLRQPPNINLNLDLPLTSSAQDLTLSSDLYEWIKPFAQTRAGANPVSMLNLLCFHPGRKEEYLVYGREFARSIGKKRGGNAKVVGNVVHLSSSSPTTTFSAAPHAPRETSSLPLQTSQTDDQGENSAIASNEEAKWDEFAVAEYPSIMHFADMLASADYQEVNQKYRVPSLADTCILCTSEVLVDDAVESETTLGGETRLGGGKNNIGAKL